jgi:hypothetical protein
LHLKKKSLTKQEMQNNLYQLKDEIKCQYCSCIGNNGTNNNNNNKNEV